MSKPIPKPGIMDIDLYVGGASHVDGVSDILKLSSNECPWGPLPASVDAVRAVAAEVHRYPSTDHVELRQAICDVHGLPFDQIICGVGSDEIIAFLCKAYAGQGDEVIYTEHGFSMYKISARAGGATPVMVGETNRHVDVDKILAGVTERTRLVFIANPANPTGTMISLDDVTRLADALPSNVILVLDGAYAEFADGYDGGAALVAERDNVVMTRTFSKLYGLGALRIGWAYAPQGIIDVLNRLRGPFNLSSVALAAATAAMKSGPYVERLIAENDKMRAYLQVKLNALGIASDVSKANFILARFQDTQTANDCDDYLKSKGIIVRRVAGYGLPNCLRITVGRPQDCERLLNALSEFQKVSL